MPKHRVFISYYHRDDQRYKNGLINWNNEKKCFDDESVEIGDINDSYMTDESIYSQIRDNYIRDATVTIVLLGLNTKHRKHVDREIGSSLRKTNYNSRCGLLIITLPEFEKYYGMQITQENAGARIAANYRNEYAEIISWNNIHLNLSQAIHKAFLKRSLKLPDNSMPYRRRNSN